MIEEPDTQVHVPPQEKLILPAHPDDERHTSTSHPSVQFRPELLIRQASTPPPPRPLVAKLRYFWHKDPAYKVLFLAVGLVLLASMLFISFASAAVLQLPSFFSRGITTAQSPSTGATPDGAVDFRPTFGTPGGGQSSTASSQPPTQGTPALQPTAMPTQPAPTPTTGPGGGGQLNVQIGNIPSPVSNFSVISVDVNASAGNIVVRLQVTYTNASPTFYQSRQQMTDGNGFATLRWRVQVSRYGLFGKVTATVVAVATDQNGQQAFSAPVTVQVIVGGG